MPNVLGLPVIFEYSMISVCSSNMNVTSGITAHRMHNYSAKSLTQVRLQSPRKSSMLSEPHYG
jgi:hypothetical protein